ncbi:transcriptional regulator [Nesterenkonia ebinurensis]|uniref:transcriptional regulator n=1 Tax=Nesterenkonia ebinurensis TaxID=2608252 RepID=UPI00123C7BD5|nr:transcriptional regulator [Nesterenkonia ebinurensis]
MGEQTWDKVLTNPHRYTILAALQESDRVAYSTFLEVLGLSKSLLSKHIAALEAAGYVRTVKVSGGYRSITELESTDLGAERFSAHQRMLLTIGTQVTHPERKVPGK